MSPTIPILSALLLSLIPGSTQESGQRTDPVALLRQTLRYWRKVYKTYQEEVALGYCWADYLLEISGELSANLSSTAATGDQRNPFPRNVMTDAATPLRRGTRRGGYLREEQSRVISARSAVIRERKKRIMQEAGVAPKENSEIHENDGITPAADERRQALTFPAELFHDGPRRRASLGVQFLSRRTSSSAINPPSNPEDDDKVGSGATGLGEDARRKVLRSLTGRHRDSSAVRGAFGPPSFSPRVSYGGRRRGYPSRSSPRGGNSKRVGVTSSDLRTQDRGMKRHPGGRVPLNDDGSRSHSQFRPANAHRRIVKLMDAGRNSSHDPANSTDGESSRAESGSDAVKGSDAREPRGSRAGRDVSTGTIHPFLLSKVSTEREIPRENWEFSPATFALSIPGERRPIDDPTRAAAPSLFRAERFTDDYGHSAPNSRLILPQNRLSLADDESPSFAAGLRSAIIAVLRTLGMFVQVGRQIIDVVESNTALVCTREYLWTKIITWID